MEQVGVDFFGTGVMVVSLKHVGTTAWLREALKMSVKMSLSSSVQSFRTQAQSMVVGRGWRLLRKSAVLCFKPGKEAVEVVEQSNAVVPGEGLLSVMV